MNRNIKTVVPFSGARDHYQLPIALNEGEYLESFVTDFYWPMDQRVFHSLKGRLPKRLINARFSDQLPSYKVDISRKAQLFALGSRFFHTPTWIRKKDRALGAMANRIALQTDSSVFSTNYYAFDAFSAFSLPKYRFLFSLQANPVVLKNILLEEIELVPSARYSLENEIEMVITNEDFQRMTDETLLANGWVTTSSFAAKTLMDQGIPNTDIHVIPYGVDTSVFRLSENRKYTTNKKPLRVAFVGQLIQRKGLSYLLEAVRIINSKELQLVFYTRGMLDQELLNYYSDVNFEIIQGLSGNALAAELNRADIFVLPSIAEGFGLVILEAMACGLPIITTPHTCGPDVIVDGKHGFIIPIRDSEIIAEKLEWAMHNRELLYEMGILASNQACQFTWARFRRKVREAYQEMLTNIDNSLS